MVMEIIKPLLWTLLLLSFNAAAQSQGYEDEKLQIDPMVKQCEDEIELGECDDKKCSDVCNKQFSNTTSSSCLPNGGTCQCYHICNLQYPVLNFVYFSLDNKSSAYPFECTACEKGHVVDCWQDIHIVGCTNSECYGACLQNVRGAVSGTCLRAGTGDQNCQCQIPCGGS